MRPLANLFPILMIGFMRWERQNATWCMEVGHLETSPPRLRLSHLERLEEIAMAWKLEVGSTYEDGMKMQEEKKLKISDVEERAAGKESIVSFFLL